MKIKLRDYQINACKNIVKEIEKGNKEILFCMATGSGKSLVMAKFSMVYANKNKKSLIIVNRKELINQQREYQDDEHFFGCLTADKFENSNIVVAMYQTLQFKLRQEKYQEWFSQFDYIWIDEAHDVFEGNGVNLIKGCKKQEAVIIYVTASPWDEKGYLLNCDSFIKGADTKDLIDMGYLVPPETYISNLFNFDKAKISKLTGDYNVEDVENIVIDTDKMDKVLEGYLQYAKNLKTIGFCSSVKSAQKYTIFFKQNGINAEYLTGESPEKLRKKVLKDFKDGLIDVLFSVSLFVAGFNMPEIEAGLFLAPTKLLRRHIQSCGRLLRICPEINKKRALILDFVGNNLRLGHCDDIQIYQKAPIKRDESPYKQCPECGNILAKHIKICDVCGYDFSSMLEATVTKQKKSEIEWLEKAMNLQKELKHNIYELVKEQGYKPGFSYYLFIDTLKSKKPTESVIKFFQRKMQKIEKIRKKKWKISSLQYD